MSRGCPAWAVRRAAGRDDQRPGLSRLEFRRTSPASSTGDARRAAAGASRRHGPLGWQIDPYEGHPRYDCVRSSSKHGRPIPIPTQRTAGSHQRSSVETMETAQLRGMGGAGFRPSTNGHCPQLPREGEVPSATATKASRAHSKIASCSAAPHLVIEGITLVGLVTGADRGWIFVRHEYRAGNCRVRGAMAAGRALGGFGSANLGLRLLYPADLFVSPGGYICGEETALLEAMEDRRAEPRNKPPLMSSSKVFSGPAHLSTMSRLFPGCRRSSRTAATGIVARGKWRHRLAVHLDQRRRERAGRLRIPFGQTIGEFIFDWAGGVSGGRG